MVGAVSMDPSGMNTQQLDQVLSDVKRGGKILFGRDQYGRSKVKIKYGPFNLFTRRYTLDAETSEALRTHLHRH